MPSIQVIIGAAIIFGVFVSIICVAARAYLTESVGTHGKTGRHDQNNGNVNREWLHQARTISDDTVQLSSFDRTEYMTAQERITQAREHDLFVANNDTWTEEIREMFADAARIEADLQSGRLAFPEWIWRDDLNEPILEDTASAVREVPDFASRSADLVPATVRS